MMFVYSNAQCSLIPGFVDLKKCTTRKLQVKCTENDTIYNKIYTHKTTELSSVMKETRSPHCMTLSDGLALDTPKL